MKRLLITTTAAAIALSTAAFAESDSQLRMSVESELDAHNFNVDVSTLSDEQVAEVYAITQSDDDSGERIKLMSVLGDAGYQHMELGEEMIFVKLPEDMPMPPANDLRAEVGLKLDEYGIKADASELSDDQVAKIFAIVQNSDGEAQREKIETIIQ